MAIIVECGLRDMEELPAPGKNKSARLKAPPGETRFSICLTWLQ
jgi:hypothetical protein